MTIPQRGEDLERWDSRRDDPVSLDDLRMAIRFMGVGGEVVCLHSRLGSFPWVGDGYGNLGLARAIVGLFLDAGCTLVVPTYTDHFSCPPPDGVSPARNAVSRNAGSAWRYHSLIRQSWRDRGLPEGYTKSTRMVDMKSMGIVPVVVANWPGRSRGGHPLMSFSAVGPRAREVVRLQTPSKPHGHFDAVDRFLMMGTPFERLTLIHYAEQRSGRQLFVRWARVGQAAKVTAVRYGGCSEGFGRLGPILRPLAREAYVGDSRWLALPREAALDAATTAIRDAPEITRCAADRCERCDDMIAGGPLLDSMVPVSVDSDW